MNRAYRWFLKSCANWWPDDERPEWLRAAIRRDAVLAKHDSELQSVADRLREEASAWRAAETKAGDANAPRVAAQGSDAVDPAMPTSDRTSTPKPVDGTHRAVKDRSSRNRRLARLGWCTAAALLIAIGWRWQATRPGISKPGVEPQVSINAQQVNEELKALVRIYENSMQEIESSVATVSDRTNRPVDLSNVSTLRAKVIAPVESYSRAYVRALARLAKSPAATHETKSNSDVRSSQNDA